jgi:CheY-like chemotaxis protein
MGFSKGHLHSLPSTNRSISQFTPENGNIVVKINSEQPDKDGRVVFHGSVTDDGVGMTEAEQQRLFKRFSQANKRVAQTYKGSGLGLSISKEIVKVLGGDMSVTSSPGLGSTFSWTTIHKSPSRQELTSHLESAASETTNVEKYSIQASTSTHTPTLTWPSPPPPKFKRICVAEDNPINLRHLAKNLETLGYEYVLCVNGQEALDSFRRADSDIDAVIIDMSMPVMDGLEATRLMREYEDETEQREKGGKEGEKEGGKEGGREGGKEEEKEEEREKEEQGKEKGSDANSRRPLTRRTPIIALSGNAMREQVQEAMAAGTSDYMIKPCKRAQLLSMLNHWERIQHQGSAHTPLVVK